MSLDMNKMLQQVQQMQAEMAKAQEELATEEEIISLMKRTFDAGRSKRPMSAGYAGHRRAEGNP